jgi:phosphate transport system permease protein
MASKTADEQAFVGERSELVGQAFKTLCFGSTVFGLVAVVALLLYVAVDAFRPLSADPGWNLVFFLTLVLPSLGLIAYFYARDSRAGSVALSALGLPVVGLLVGGGVVVVFVELLTPQAWFLFVVSLLVAAAVVYAHRRLRPERELEGLAVLLFAPLLSVFGIPPLAVDFTFRSPVYGAEIFTIAFSTPRLLPSVRALVDMVPVLPVGWILLVATFTLPVGLVAGWYVLSRRESVRDAQITVAAVALGGVAAAFAGPLIGVNSENAIVLYTTVVVPAAVYVESVLRRGEGVSGLAMPVVVVGGMLVGAALVEALGFAGPDAWLTWDYLTSAHSRTPTDAGIYPALVGSILMILVVIAASFPLGVGAAIYLEEYAPDQGRLGSLVTLIEINIGNLAGVPSVVYGLLGLALFIRGIGFEPGIVAVGGLTIGLLILPIVIISAQEAIRSVPDSHRRASYGMGATKWQTTRNVVLPEAMPGILTGTILALGRAIGETAPLLMIGAAAVVRLPPDGFFAKFSAMPRQILAWSTEIDPEFRRGVLAAGVITLLLVLLIMNATAIVIRNKYQRREQA